MALPGAPSSPTEASIREERAALSAALPEVDAWGRERGAHGGSGHAELRAVLDVCRHAGAAASEPVLLARRARDLAARVRETLGREERDGVRPAVPCRRRRRDRADHELAPPPVRGRGREVLSMIRELSRPFRPVELGGSALHLFQLLELGEALRGEDEYRSSGVAALTLARDAHLTMLLVALRAGSVMREHRAPSAGTALLLAGRGHFVTAGGEERSPLEPGAVAAFSADLPHAVEAEEDALYVVTIGGRDRPQSGA